MWLNYQIKVCGYLSQSELNAVWLNSKANLMQCGKLSYNKYRECGKLSHNKYKECGKLSNQSMWLSISQQI